MPNIKFLPDRGYARTEPAAGYISMRLPRLSLKIIKLHGAFQKKFGSIDKSGSAEARIVTDDDPERLILPSCNDSYSSDVAIMLGEVANK